ncbi:hypothetical protein GMSM_19690 [Geomonas sp. Red276]
MTRSECSFLTMLLVLLFTVPTVCAASKKMGKSDEQAKREMITKVGDYYLGQRVSTARGLVELAPEEYAVLRSFPGWIDMPGEKVFKAPKVTLNRHAWYLTIGSLDGKIYTLGLQGVGNDQAAADTLFQKTLDFARSQMGAPTEQTNTPKRCIWDASNGNVILAERGAQGFWSVNFLLTAKRSSVVRLGSLTDLDAQNGYGSLHFGDTVPAGMVYQSTVPDPAGKVELYAWPDDDGKFDDVIVGTAYYCFRDGHLVSVHFFAPADQSNAEALMNALRTKFGPPAPLATQPNAFQWEARRVLLTVGLGETPIFIEFRSTSDVARIIKSLERRRPPQRVK